MKTLQKGSIVPLLLIIIAILVVGGGAYVFTQTKSADQIAIINLTSTTVTGLPKEIENNKEFMAFISDKGGSADKSLLPFEVSSSGKLNLESKRIDTDQNRHLYFDNSGNPIFMPAEPENKTRIEGYSPDKLYASEVLTSEPDSFAYLWDLREKKLFQIGSCGTVCVFSGISWMDNDKVIVWGNQANPEGYGWSNGSAKFVTVFDLKNLSVTSYSSKIIPLRTQ